MSLDARHRRGHMLDEVGELGAVFQSCLHRPVRLIEPTQAPQCGAELRRVTHLLAERQRPGLGLLHLRGRMAFGQHQDRPQR